MLCIIKTSAYASSSTQITVTLDYGAGNAIIMALVKVVKLFVPKASGVGALHMVSALPAALFRHVLRDRVW